MAIVRPFEGQVPAVGDGVFLADNAVIIGAVELKPLASVWFGAVLRADVGEITVGERSNIQDNATIHMTYQRSHARIGADCIIGHNAVIHGAVMGDRVLIGMGSVVMDNAELADGAWVAAGSVVPPGMKVGPGMLARGAPARVVRMVLPEEALWATEAVDRYLRLAVAHSQAAGSAVHHV